MVSIVYYKRIGTLLILTLFLSCDIIDEYLTVQDLYNPKDTKLELWCELERYGDTYHYNFDRTKNHSYGKVYFKTQPRERVSWFSPNEFYVLMFNDTIYTPSIQYSTYSRDDGSGLQNFYISPQFIGDTLYLYGYVNNETVDMVKVYVK